MKVKLAVSALALLCCTANAAEIKSFTADNGFRVITIEGLILSGDFNKFERTIIGGGRGVVVLASPGGAAADALAIGETIHAKRYGTYVPAGFRCESACALIWLAGSPPTVSSKATVGFHAVHVNGVPSTQGNALVGAYLHALSLPMQAIVAFTETPPTSMRYFTHSELIDLGVTVQVKEFDSTPPSQPKSPPAALDTELKAKAVSFSQRYVSAFSSGRGLEGLYSEEVLYYKSARNRKAVLADFAYLAKKWPVRRYRIDRVTSVACTSNRCIVGLVWAWDNSDRTRNARSVGTATLNLVLRLREDETFIIDAVDGEVTSRQISELVPQKPQACLFGLCIR